ncbi:NUDIX domain-containing protein [Kineococcus xinjiangensis]|uniref:NUDIX domain-containing protein n=1 Tax=Kineococcus xinjiangensis TaxID=512762 RepID=UPI001FED0056|nr:NUDIX domain-containing protein [Kineococcus xinjiangensis]
MSAAERTGAAAAAAAAAARELVALLDPTDPDGVVVGAAPRAEVRRHNLPHAATGVLLRNGAGEVFVHRRTATKDVFPGCYDCLAGGVVAAGEDPAAAARRELAEELGVRGADLRPVLRAWYRDERTHYLAHVYEARYDPERHGPLRLQPEEVAGGEWMPPARLDRLLCDPAWPFVPDSRRLLELWPGGWQG